MLEELGPNLWEHNLDRCVDYGHTFSKVLEMLPNVDLMHGEAVNIDGFFSAILSYKRNLLTMQEVERIYRVMTKLQLPTFCDDLTIEVAWAACLDAVEHRHGAQRIPLLSRRIGNSICVSDITREELKEGLCMFHDFGNVVL